MLAMTVASRGFTYVTPAAGDWHPVATTGQKAMKEHLLINIILEYRYEQFEDISVLNELEDIINNTAYSRVSEYYKANNIDLMAEYDKTAFWFLVSYFLNNFTTPVEFKNGMINLAVNFQKPHLLYEGVCNLLNLGIAQSRCVESDEESKGVTRYILSVNAARQMFKGLNHIVKYEEIGKYVRIIKAKDIEEKQLFFSKESEEKVNDLRNILSPSGFYRASMILKRQKRNQGIQCLFWGPPGTGKTEVIKQLARESRRDLFLFEIANVIGSLWGEAEKNYSNLFTAYGYIAAISNNVPILVLNEADNILSKRLTSMQRSIDKSENTISNMLLQFFEDMSGIVLATTNLITNLDQAFDRRFLFKIELEVPDENARKCIWQSKLNILDETDAAYLARQFRMTGAQIANVVLKFDLAELYFKGERDLHYIEKLCLEETKGEFVEKQARRIGF